MRHRDGLLNYGYQFQTDDGQSYTVKNLITPEGMDYQVISGGDLMAKQLAIEPVYHAKKGVPFGCRFLDVKENGGYQGKMLITSAISDMKSIGGVQTVAAATYSIQDALQPNPNNLRSVLRSIMDQPLPEENPASFYQQEASKQISKSYTGYIFTTKSGHTYTVTDQFDDSGSPYQVISGGNLKRDQLAIEPVKSVLNGNPFSCRFLQTEANGPYAGKVMTTSVVTKTMAVHESKPLTKEREMGVLPEPVAVLSPQQNQVHSFSPDSAGFVVNTKHGSYQITNHVDKNNRTFQTISSGRLRQQGLLIETVNSAEVGKPFSCRFLNVPENKDYRGHVLTTSPVQSVQDVQRRQRPLPYMQTADSRNLSYEYE